MSEERTPSFGDLLKEYRLAARLTQEALAERAGVSARSIQALERGESRPHRDTAQLLAAGLSLSEQDRARFLAAATPAPRLRAARSTSASDDVPKAPEPALASLPSGMLTFLITDVRGYTAYTHEHGDAAGARLATRFAEVAGAAVTGRQGQVVEVRGDEVMAVFTSARSALRAAVDLLASCAAAATPELPLRAGVGLDVGEPVAVPGGYRGEAINLAARLCQQAGPGEILASEAVVGLARRIEGLAYLELGEITLKGLARPVRAWLVRSESTSFDPGGVGENGYRSARPAGAQRLPPHNLPAALSPLIGREQEQIRVRELLADVRLVTLTGAGGVGKTRLALAVAQELAGSNPDGTWLVELAALADPALLPSVVAGTLGLREEPGRSLQEGLAGHLRSRRVLLVLDNCEHLSDACAELVTTLLQACPALRILATSQEPLGVVGERRYRVPSLAIPDPRQLPSYELLERYDAVRLFIARAQERRDDFVLTPANAQAVAEICARLDGIPMALELAAARVGSLPVQTIAARLDDRFALLTTGARSALPRQKTLRATLDWSYDLLSLPEQTLLQRLATFAGGSSLEAVEAVCADPAPGPTDGSTKVWGTSMIADQALLDLLDALVQRSLVQAEQGRYGLLETIRTYAHERLSARGQEEAVRWRHVRYYLRVAENVRALLTGPEQGQWLAQLEVEHDNLRAALQWARERGDSHVALRLAAALWRFWYLRGHLSEGRAWLEGALAHTDSNEQHADVSARATAYHGASVLAWTQGDDAHAMVLARQALALWQTIGDRAGSGAALNLLGLVAIDQGNWDQAATALEESLAQRRELSDRWGIATSVHNLGTVARGQGDYERAAALYAESLALRVTLGDAAGLAISYRDQAVLAVAQEDESRALSLFRESLQQAVSLGDLVGVAQNLEGLAVITVRQVRAEQATQLLGAAAALREVVGAPLAPAERVAHDRLLAVLRAAQGQAFDAAWIAGRGVPWAELVEQVFG